MDLLREPSEPNRPDSRKIAFYCDTQGPAQAVPRPAVQHGQEAAQSPAGIISVLLYPMSFDGLAHTVTLALALWIIRVFLGLYYPFSRDFRVVFPAVVGYLLIAWHAMRYFAFCVFDSSKGGRRAPAVFSGYLYTGGELPALLLMGAVALCLWPAALYRVFVGDTDLYFWLLAFPSAFVLPMMLLACTLLADAEALNPAFIIRSIADALPAYLGLIAGLAFLLSFAAALHWVSRRYGLPRVLSYAAYLYILWIAGHLLGRFYVQQKDKLQWGL